MSSLVTIDFELSIYRLLANEGVCGGAEAAFLESWDQTDKCCDVSVYLSDYREISRFFLLILLLLTFAKPAVSSSMVEDLIEHSLGIAAGSNPVLLYISLISQNNFGKVAKMFNFGPGIPSLISN